MSIGSNTKASAATDSARARLASELGLIAADWPDRPEKIRAYVSTRNKGCSEAPYGGWHGQLGLNLGAHVGDVLSDVQANRAKLNGVLPQPVIFPTQCHGILCVSTLGLEEKTQADAVWTNQPATVCGVLTADCLPLLICSLDGQYMAAVHAGWRGLAAGVVASAVQALRTAGAGELTVWLGPAISQAAFEVGDDVFHAFTDNIPGTQACFRYESSRQKYFADIFGLARVMLAQLDVQRVYGGDFCTYNDPENFYSFRREHSTGRMASLIWREA